MKNKYYQPKTNQKPTQKVGKLKKKIDVARIDLLTRLLGFKPAITPNGIPKMIAINKAEIVNSNVAGKRSSIRVIAGRL